MLLGPVIIPKYQPVTSYSFHSAAASVTHTDMTAGLVEYNTPNIFRMLVSTVGYQQARIVTWVATAGTASSVILGQYSLDGGSTWFDMTADCSIGSPTGAKASVWQDLPTACLNNDALLVRLAQRGGDGVADPLSKHTNLHLR